MISDDLALRAPVLRSLGFRAFAMSLLRHVLASHALSSKLACGGP
jgi:hypothetical protein